MKLPAINAACSRFLVTPRSPPERRARCTATGVSAAPPTRRSRDRREHKAGNNLPVESGSEGIANQQTKFLPFSRSPVRSSHFPGTSRPMNPPPARSVMVSEPCRVSVARSMRSDAALSGSSRTSNALYERGPRNFKSTRRVRASGPFNTATNHSSPFRRAKAASSPMALPGSTIVSSHVLGSALITSTAGFSRRLLGLAP